MMITLIAGLLLFLGIHSVSIADANWRDRCEARLGEKAWKGLYSLISAVGLALIIIGYGQARLDPQILFYPPSWLRHITLLVLLPVFPLFLATYLPGWIKSKIKHPTLIATLLWALGHLMANGGLHDLLLFGSFLAWAVADRLSMMKRSQRPLPGAPLSSFNDIIAVVVGLGLYLLFIGTLHRWLIGIAPI
ncbi:MAG: NnrU family protein [Halopseudomonas sp.]